MVAANTTTCSTSMGLYKNIKNVREFCQYLTSRKIDRTQIWRKVGNVLVVDKVALEQGVKDAGQQSQKRSVIGYCSCGAVYPSRANAVGTARPDKVIKGPTESAPGICVQFLVHWQGR